MNTIKGLLLMGLVLVFGASNIFADDITVPVSDYAVISHGGGENRVLVYFQIPEEVTASNFMFAEMSVGIEPQLAGDSLLRIDCFAVTTDWLGGNVNWNQPWENPGGDFDEDRLIMFNCNTFDTEMANFDLSGAVKWWLDGTQDNYGLIFLIPEHIVSNYSLQSIPGYPDNTYAIVKFIYR